MGYRLGPGKDPAPSPRKACGYLEGDTSWLSKVRVSALALACTRSGLPFPLPIAPSPPVRRPGRFLPGKEQAGDLGGADTPHQSQWLITGVRAQPHVRRFP